MKTFITFLLTVVYTAASAETALPVIECARQTDMFILSFELKYGSNTEQFEAFAHLYNKRVRQGPSVGCRLVHVEGTLTGLTLLERHDISRESEPKFLYIYRYEEPPRKPTHLASETPLK